MADEHHEPEWLTDEELEQTIGAGRRANVGQDSRNLDEEPEPGKADEPSDGSTGPIQQE